MKPTLLVLAAGMGSRYGSLKQMDGIGPSNEAIIDYSIYDALRAGFGKVQQTQLEAIELLGMVVRADLKPVANVGTVVQKGHLNTGKVFCRARKPELQSPHNARVVHVPELQPPQIIRSVAYSPSLNSNHCPAMAVVVFLRHFTVVALVPFKDIAMQKCELHPDKNRIRVDSICKARDLQTKGKIATGFFGDIG